jgi:hypothetical protein
MLEVLSTDCAEIFWGSYWRKIAISLRTPPGQANGELGVNAWLHQSE